LKTIKTGFKFSLANYVTTSYVGLQIAGSAKAMRQSICFNQGGVARILLWGTKEGVGVWKMELHQRAPGADHRLGLGPSSQKPETTVENKTENSYIGQ